MARRTEPCLRRKKRQPSSSHGGWGTGKARTASTFSPSLRYATNTGDYLIFSTRTTIYLEFEGTTFREWNIPPLCTVGDKTMQRTTLHCSVPGTHQIGPVVTVPSPDDEERFLSIIADVNCFMWYIHQDVHRLSKKFSVQHLHAWIFDPENAEGSEINHTATSPPIYSKTLSKQFWNWGESPTISTFFGQKMYTAPLYNDGIWTHRVPTLSNDNIAMIFGKAVTFQDCFILDTPFVIAQPVQHLSNPAYIPVTSPPGSLAQVTWAACFPLTAVLVTDFGIFFTSDGFLNTEIIKIPAKILNTTLYNSVNDVAIAFPNVFILIGDMLYKASEYEIIKIGSGHNVPDSKIIGVQAKTWCSAEYPSIDRPLSDLLIWTAEEIIRGFPNNFFIPLVDMGLLKERLNFRRNLQLIIITACYDSLTTVIAVLVQCTGCLATDILYLVFYNEASDSWTLGDFSLAPSATGHMSMEVLSSARKSMVFWDNDLIFYSYKENTDHGFLKISGTTIPFSAAAERSAIHQIIIDYGGNAVIKLNNNVLYFFKFEMNDVVKLPAWQNPTRHFVFYLNPAGDLYILSIDARVVQRAVYPLKLEVSSAAWKLGEVCPYISFHHNMNQNIYYLDMGDSVAFWAQIVFLENLGLSVDIEVFNGNLLKKDTYLHYEIARGICTKNQTITFYHEEDYSKVFDYESSVILAQGVVTVEIQPSSAGKTCDKKVKLTHLRVGCSPEKRIEVAGKPTECENITFTIPWSSLINPTKEEDVEINYDIKTYGCPLEVDYEETFRPTVLLYMGERAIGTVEANYVLWEMNGRNDFNYNSTMEQVRCLNTAQTWQKAIEKINRTSSLTPDEVESLWGPRTLAVAAAAAAAGEATAHAGMQSRAMSYNGEEG
ncbi:cation channel sperm-associated auxiliary subunit epsilon isoform X2 [Anolis carolinensis]|uniref:cation channel sperm-associated auxiliary subunit epsilon isoform X2 n=1 Tax=Anolis carolinensis TaxID=28377 RepID=UPI002F2B3551